MEGPKKAKYGEPCTRCGECCMSECCEIVLTVLPDAEPPCPALSYDEESGRYECPFIVIEQESLPPEKWLLTKGIGINKGCTNREGR